MRCPACSSLDDKVVDSRIADDGAAIRRRRECLACGRRFTTYERLEEVPFMVVKRSGDREPFDRAKVVAGLRAACKNRPVTDEQLERLHGMLTAQGRLARSGSSFLADVARIALWDERRERLAFRYTVGALPPGQDEMLLARGTRLAGEALTTGRPVRRSSLRGDLQLHPEHADGGRAEGSVAALVAPIRMGERVEGVLYVDNRRPHAFTERDEAVLVRLADHAAIALRNAQLFAGEQAARAEAETRAHRARLLADVSRALALPGVIIGGMKFGVFTPTEAAAVAVVYALIVPPLFYGEPSLRELPKIFADSARLSGVIGLIIGLVGAFGWVLTYSKFPFVVAEAIGSIAPTWWLFMTLVMALYILLGTFLTPSEIILVTVPVLLPGAVAAGIHPIHFGMVCVIASAVGHITPPVGLCLFVGMSISGLPMERLLRPLVPFLVAIIAVLFVVAFVPQITLWLPTLFGFVK